MKGLGLHGDLFTTGSIPTAAQPPRTWLFSADVGHLVGVTLLCTFHDLMQHIMQRPGTEKGNEALGAHTGSRRSVVTLAWARA